MPDPRFPSEVRLREVGPRDGLQSESPLAPEVRASLIASLLRAGFTSVEAVSFVSPKAVPSMADPDKVLTKLKSLMDFSGLSSSEDVTITALVPNRRGAELALQSDVVDEITVTISASDEYNRRNVQMSTSESGEAVVEICRLADLTDVPVDAVVSCAFGSPYEGDVPAKDVKVLVDRLRDAGSARVTLADTTGMATPRVIGEVLELTGPDVGLHLHDTRGTGLVNVFFALQNGVTRFDTSVGGLGGSPFAAGASGNVSSEDAVYLLEDLGISTGVDLVKLLDVTATLEGLVGHALASKVAHAGPRLAGPDAARGPRVDERSDPRHDS